MAVLVTLKKSSVAAGVTMALLVWIGSPSIAKLTDIGPTVEPSVSAMFPLKVT